MFTTDSTTLVKNHSRPSSFILGIDASRAITDAPTGTEYYSRALIIALVEADSNTHFRLYTRTTPPLAFFPLTTNYEIRAIPFPRLWTHFRLSYEMATQPPNALFVPAHVLPLLHPRNALVTVHDLGYKYFPGAHPSLSRYYLDLSTRWSVHAVRIVIADSTATRDDIIRFYGTLPEKIRVVYPSYNPDIFKPTHDQNELARVRTKYALGKPYLISVGTLHPRKNYGRLLEAFSQISGEYTLVIVGKKGWRADEILAQAGTLNLGDRVRFLNYVPIADLPALYAGAELAVLPSLYEGFGFPALEAQACGTPLVCSNSSSLPEVAGEGALYFDPRDVGGMADAISAVLSDKNLQHALTAGGLENVQRFSWDRAANEILQIIGHF